MDRADRPATDGSRVPDTDGARANSPHDRIHRILVDDLERRLSLLETAGEDQFGPFTSLDWALCLLLFVFLPLLLVVWFA